jgi:hypothetical protein
VRRNEIPHIVAVLYHEYCFYFHSKALCVCVCVCIHVEDQFHVYNNEMYLNPPWPEGVCSPERGKDKEAIFSTMPITFSPKK